VGHVVTVETAGKVFERLLPRRFPWSYWTQRGRTLASLLTAGQTVPPTSQTRSSTSL